MKIKRIKQLSSESWLPGSWLITFMHGVKVFLIRACQLGFFWCFQVSSNPSQAQGLTAITELVSTMNSNNSWRSPSAQQMQKYDLTQLPDNFEPTEEEQSLLDMYDVIRSYERQAARLKEEAARKKLEAADAEFQQQRQAPKRKKRKRVKESFIDEAGVSDDEDDNSEDDSDEDDISDDEEEDPQALHERREAKLAALREEVNEAKQSQQAEEDMRQKHLNPATQEFDDEEGPSLKRKRANDDDLKQPQSLIANLKAAATPPHEFSEKLGLTRGKVLFPKSTDEVSWEPPEGVVSPNDGAFLANLDSFDVAKAQNGIGNNTLAIKFTVPKDSKRFSINIAESDHNDFDSVLFHFNPRQRERGGQLVVNDKKDGIWGQAIAIPLSQVPLMFGQQSCTLMIQVNGEGFDIFVENKHCARLEHRKVLQPGNTSLVLQFPSTDDFGSPENWTVFRVWWGNRPIMAKGDLSAIPGVNSYNSLHPRKLFVGGLTKIFSDSEVDVRRAELERAFRKYGGDRGVQVIVPTKTTYAFVEMESERQCDLALKEMAGQYRLNRARRTRHEALQEERAAAEASKVGNSKQNKEWD